MIRRSIPRRGIQTLLLLVAWCAAPQARAAGDEPPHFSGIYPHLAFFNNEQECGTGAVVPWADRLWVVTYAPHKPLGSSDKLYEIDERLRITVRPESVGGTPANRMIHRESGQLLIGPYVIDRQRNVRVIPPAVMPGRLTGNARHLVDPERRVYFATMEEGFYEVDVHSLAVTELFADANRSPDSAGTLLPGYHGKGLYSAQGRLIYANNGENSPEARRRPDIESGCLAAWDGSQWTVVARKQFTEVTGPGGIYGNAHPADDPVWTIGWDHRSLLLMVLDQGRWHRYRLPKASHCYDGAHGWNTEWPRIRDIDEDDWLMTMHGMFWRFPPSFRPARAAGIRPRSTYLKVVGDFCRWRNQIVLGCDDTAASAFLNHRAAKGRIAGPGQSQSNLWFVAPRQLDRFGPPIGRGAVWLNDPVAAGEPSDPFLLAGFARRGLHLAQGGDEPLELVLEIDLHGSNHWQPWQTVTVPPAGYIWLPIAELLQGEWIRLRPAASCPRVTAFFHFAARDQRTDQPDAIFASLAAARTSRAAGGVIRARGGGKQTLHFAAVSPDGARLADVGYYELAADMRLRRIDDPPAHAWLKENVAIAPGVLSSDAASLLFVDEDQTRYRLPRGAAHFDEPGPCGPERAVREVCTERDLLHAHGTFYELPADNAGGFARLRPIASHPYRISDFCSWRGLLVISGVAADRPADDHHIVASDDGRTALWVGAVDDLWKLGKPRGRGGPWKDSPVEPGVPSDPYLMTGYDRKRLTLSHTHAAQVTIRIEVDISGSGQWQTYAAFTVQPGETIEHLFPAGFNACWMRTVSSQPATATAQLVYE